MRDKNEGRYLGGEGTTPVTTACPEEAGKKKSSMKGKKSINRIIMVWTRRQPIHPPTRQTAAGVADFSCYYYQAPQLEEREPKLA